MGSFSEGDYKQVVVICIEAIHESPEILFHHDVGVGIAHHGVVQDEGPRCCQKFFDSAHYTETA